MFGSPPEWAQDAKVWFLSSNLSFSGRSLAATIKKGLITLPVYAFGERGFPLACGFAAAAGAGTGAGFFTAAPDTGLDPLSITR